MKVVPKDSTVSVRTVNCIIPLQFGNSTQELVHLVALPTQIVHLLQVVLHSEVAQNPLQQEKCEEVRVSPRGGVVEYTHILHLHGVISYIQQPWFKLWSFHIQNLNSSVCSL